LCDDRDGTAYLAIDLTEGWKLKLADSMRGNVRFALHVSNSGFEARMSHCFPFRLKEQEALTQPKTIQFVALKQLRKCSGRSRAVLNAYA
jgi:hypothetical protein